MPTPVNLTYSAPSAGSINFSYGGKSFIVSDGIYRNLNLDVDANISGGGFADGLNHWLSAGWQEGRSLELNHAGRSAVHFVEKTYLEANLDVKAAVAAGHFQSGFEHWLIFGSAETRTTGVATYRGSAADELIETDRLGLPGFYQPREIWGHEGNDTISAPDIIYGNQGNDSISNASIMYGGKGADTIIGSASDSMIYGNMDDDLIYGGNSTITRRSGNDYIHGGQGNDTIYGQGDNDTLYGGLGADQFRFDGNTATAPVLGRTGLMTIRDFNADQGDRIAIRSTDELGDFSKVLANATDSALGVVLNLAPSFSARLYTLTLTGVAKDQLQADWFVFS